MTLKRFTSPIADCLKLFFGTEFDGKLSHPSLIIVLDCQLVAWHAHYYQFTPGTEPLSRF